MESSLSQSENTTASTALSAGGAKRKIRLSGEHMNLQPSAPISGQKIRNNI
jgi:hypothetical protein